MRAIDDKLTDPYSELVRRLFKDPAHAGRLADGQRVFVADQGVKIALYMRRGSLSIEALRFEAWGCPHVIAAAEAFCREYEFRPVAELAAFSARTLIERLGIPIVKTGRILVLEDAVNALVG